MGGKCHLRGEGKPWPIPCFRQVAAWDDQKNCLATLAMARAMRTPIIHLMLPTSPFKANNSVFNSEISVFVANCESMAYEADTKASASAFA